MSEAEKALDFLKTEVEKREKRIPMSFEEFLGLVRAEPERVLRNIFQLFYDMTKSNVIMKKDEYPDDPESVGFVEYDCSKIFVEEVGNPFFPDRLFANRLVRQVESLKQGSQQNKIYVFFGPSGCGKSTFLNNFLQKFEKYTKTKEGQSFEIFWEINGDLLPKDEKKDEKEECVDSHPKKIEISCPSHDHPILIVPRDYRVKFLDELLADKLTPKEKAEIWHKISEEKEYEWIFKEEACTICKSLFWALFDKLGSLDKVLEMVRVRPYNFDRRLGEGISIFNPGDTPMKERCLTDKKIQEKLDQLFGANLVKYVYSKHAMTNNGIYVLMDIKSHNEERLLELHNVVSEGVHKVNGTIEEQINSLHIALMNPEDVEKIKDEKMESFQERIKYIKIPYVLEPQTEVKIYRSIFGDHIDSRFLPRVLENFARVIISSRMNDECEPFKEWIGHMEKYEKYCDESGRLLRMEIYSGVIPPWLSEEDKKNFKAQVRKDIIAEGEKEGEKGFSGRDSIGLFDEFLSRYGGKPNLIGMKDVVDYFKHNIGKVKRNKNIPENFLGSLVNWYDYVVLSEVKESIYFYNKEQIQEDILNYLCLINHEVGEKVKCEYTGKPLEVTIEFLKLMGTYLTGEQMYDDDALNYARDVQQKYVELVAQGQQKAITETELYRELFAAYVKNLKEKVLHPFIENDSFQDAVKAFGTEEFKTLTDTRLRKHITFMIKNLIKKFGYSEQGAKEICLYVIDQRLVERFS